MYLPYAQMNFKLILRYMGMIHADLEVDVHPIGLSEVLHSMFPNSLGPDHDREAGEKREPGEDRDQTWPMPVESIVTRWETDKFSCGAYSFQAVPFRVGLEFIPSKRPHSEWD